MSGGRTKLQKLLRKEWLCPLEQKGKMSCLDEGTAAICSNCFTIQRIEKVLAEAALRAETPLVTSQSALDVVKENLRKALEHAECRTVMEERAVNVLLVRRFFDLVGRAETPAPREPKLTISDLDEILGGYDSAHVTRGTVLQRLNEWLRIRAAGEPEQAKWPRRGQERQ